MNIEVYNDRGPSFEVRVWLNSSRPGARPLSLGWVRLGETKKISLDVLPGRFSLEAVGRSRGQTAVLTERNPKSTRLRSDTFIIDEDVERITWTLSTNHLELQPRR